MPDRVFQEYGIHRWGAGMFARMENGDLGLVNPERPGDTPASLPDLLHKLHERGVHTPVLVRVGAFLRRQLEHLNQAFASAITTSGYQGTYRGVFPIKVNQQAEVIDRIVDLWPSVSVWAGSRVKAGTDSGAVARPAQGRAADLQRDQRMPNSSALAFWRARPALTAFWSSNRRERPTRLLPKPSGWAKSPRWACGSN